MLNVESTCHGNCLCSHYVTKFFCMEKARPFSHFTQQDKMASPNELALVIERACAAGVRAALKDRPMPTSGTSLVATDTTSLPSVSL